MGEEREEGSRGGKRLLISPIPALAAPKRSSSSSPLVAARWNNSSPFLLLFLLREAQENVLPFSPFFLLSPLPCVSLFFFLLAQPK